MCFRNFIPNKYYAVAAAEKISAMSKVKNVAIMHINNDTGLTLKDGFVQNFKGNIISIEAYAPEEGDSVSLVC